MTTSSRIQLDFVRDTLIPALAAHRPPGNAALSLRVWVAGCGRGAEAYRLAIVVREAIGERAWPRWSVRLLATDADPDALAFAADGIYDRAGFPQDVIAWQPSERYLLAGSGEQSGLVKVKSELQDLFTFRPITLAADSWPIQAGVQFDMIVCLTGFADLSELDRVRLTERFEERLSPGGFLMTEPFQAPLGIHPSCERLAPGIYRFDNALADRTARFVPLCKAA